MSSRDDENLGFKWTLASGSFWPTKYLIPGDFYKTCSIKVCISLSLKIELQYNAMENAASS